MLHSKRDYITKTNRLRQNLQSKLQIPLKSQSEVSLQLKNLATFSPSTKHMTETVDTTESSGY